MAPDAAAGSRFEFLQIPLIRWHVFLFFRKGSLHRLGMMGVHRVVGRDSTLVSGCMYTICVLEILLY
jgi:hypothetical protein